MIAMTEFTATLIAICSDPSASDCARTLPCPAAGVMNCGSS
jgi:hypothetical protein